MNAAHTIEKTVMNLTPGPRRFARVHPRQLPENLGKNRAIVYVYFRSKKCCQTLPLSHGARCELDGFWREGISLGLLLLTHCSRAATRMRRRHQSQRLWCRLRIRVAARLQCVNSSNPKLIPSRQNPSSSQRAPCESGNVWQHFLDLKYT